MSNTDITIEIITRKGLSINISPQELKLYPHNLYNIIYCTLDKHIKKMQKKHVYLSPRSLNEKFSQTPLDGGSIKLKRTSSLFTANVHIDETIQGTH